MQAVFLTFKYFQHADENKLLQQGSFIKLSMVDSSLILDFALQRLPGAVRASNGTVCTAAWQSSVLARAIHTCRQLG